MHSVNEQKVLQPPKFSCRRMAPFYHTIVTALGQRHRSFISSALKALNNFDVITIHKKLFEGGSLVLDLTVMGKKMEQGLCP